ncbi:transmembrane transporter [Aureococcus anophagefferens]|nr:transmembrane transporter [Aureococcus anophagefferens]
MAASSAVPGALLLANALFGAGSVVGSIGLPSMNPLVFASLREASATLILGCVALVVERRAAARKPRDAPPPVAPRRYLYASLGVCVFLDQGCSIAGIKLSDAVTQSIWQTTQPVITAALSRVVFGEPLTWRRSCGVACAFAGCLAMVGLGALSSAAPGVARALRRREAALPRQLHGVVGVRDPLKGAAPDTPTVSVTFRTYLRAAHGVDDDGRQRERAARGGLRRLRPPRRLARARARPLGPGLLGPGPVRRRLLPRDLGDAPRVVDARLGLRGRPARRRRGADGGHPRRRRLRELRDVRRRRRLPRADGLPALGAVLIFAGLFLVVRTEAPPAPAPSRTAPPRDGRRRPVTYGAPADAARSKRSRGVAPYLAADHLGAKPALHFLCATSEDEAERLRVALCQADDGDAADAADARVALAGFFLH